MIFSIRMLPYAKRAFVKKVARLYNNAVVILCQKLRIKTKRQYQPILVDTLTRDERRRICDGCVHRKGFQCGICLCNIPLKTMFADEACPDPEVDGWNPPF